MFRGEDIKVCVLGGMETVKTMNDVKGDPPEFYMLQMLRVRGGAVCTCRPVKTMNDVKGGPPEFYMLQMLRVRGGAVCTCRPIHNIKNVSV